MKAPKCIVLLGFLLAAPLACYGQNVTLQISQDAVNKLVSRLGVMGDSGLYQPFFWIISSAAKAKLGITNAKHLGVLLCPKSAKTPAARPLSIYTARTAIHGNWWIFPEPPPINWQWWVINPQFTINNGSMTFTATVRSVVGGTQNSQNVSGPVSLTFDPNTNELSANITVSPVQISTSLGDSITQVDVAQLYNLSFPIQPQTVSVTLPDGTTPTLTARATSISVQYLAGRAILTANVGF